MAAKKSRQTFMKRQREMQLQEKRERKREKKAALAAAKAAAAAGEMPDEGLESADLNSTSEQQNYGEIERLEELFQDSATMRRP